MPQKSEREGLEEAMSRLFFWGKHCAAKAKKYKGHEPQEKMMRFKNGSYWKDKLEEARSQYRDAGLKLKKLKQSEEKPSEQNDD